MPTTNIKELTQGLLPELSDQQQTSDTAKHARFINKSEVLARVGVSYPTLWSWMRSGRFPRSRELGGKAAWIESEIEQYILSRPVRRLKGDP